MKPILQVSANGLYCEAGDFYVDPWCPVERAVVTHAHSDHAQRGSKRYLTSTEGESVLRARMGAECAIEAFPYGQAIDLNGVKVSLHPAGHILGSSQIRMEYRGEVWVASGDYKLERDPTCTPFEAVRCHTFLTESTFGLPIYRWTNPVEVAAEIDAWRRRNRDAGKASILFGYALGKAQRCLAAIGSSSDSSIGPIYCHGAVEKLNRVYREAGVALPPTLYAGEAERGTDWSGTLIVAPPSCNGTPWMRKFGKVSTAFASGWMRIRGTRRRRSIDRGFILSDHADWPGLLSAIDATGAERILVTHGYRSALVRWLQEDGKQAEAIETRFEGDPEEES
ncbi:MAG: ligase-associated DNA damage response exonuclease [Acidobacteriota bacterium]|nr:ligase-associated DNA damage response exonuclease [Acidobacteriota bacterium]